MGFNSKATVIPGKGTVLVNAPDATAPNYLTLDPTSPSGGWVTLGHTSRNNTVAMSKDGGDATQVGSWWDEALRTTYSPINWSVTVNSLQVDSLTLSLAFGGGTINGSVGSYDVDGTITPAAKSIFILVQDGLFRLGIYIPNVTVTIGDAPEFPVDDFFEIQLSAQMLNSPTTGKRFRILHPELRDAVAATVTSALPSAAVTGATVTIVGNHFLNATAVTFGGASANFTITNDEEIKAVVPTGSAGSAAVVVTNATGASNSLAYTRGA